MNMKSISKTAIEKAINIFDSVGWVNAAGYPEGAMMKTLSEEGGVRTFIMKVPEGYYLKEHSHSFCKQQFLLKGKYLVNGELHDEGTFLHYKPNENHGPYEVLSPSLILVIYYPESLTQQN